MRDILVIEQRGNKRKIESIMSDISEKQIKRLKVLIQEAETSVAAAKELLISMVGDDSPEMSHIKDEPIGKIIEGVFDGQAMMGGDGKTYPVPANYASKSRLVQGDILKLTITDDGTFMYKQISRVDRLQKVGLLILENGQYYVEIDKKRLRVLLASVTYFKAKPGDQVSVDVPADIDEAEWAALESPL